MFPPSNGVLEATPTVFGFSFLGISFPAFATAQYGYGWNVKVGNDGVEKLPILPSLGGPGKRVVHVVEWLHLNQRSTVCNMQHPWPYGRFRTFGQLQD
jgi:hypothetical protein